MRQRLALVAGLAQPTCRQQAARALASDVGAEDLAIFVRDPESMALLPVQGLPQTWPRPWREFLAEVCGRGEHAGYLPLPASTARVSARAIATPDSSAVLVLLGGTPEPGAIGELAALLPLLAQAFTHEQALGAAATRADVARRAASEARSLAEALDASRRALQQEVRTREEFLAAASHDLKNPLAVIKGIAQMVRRHLDRPAGLAPERLRKALESIEAAVEQMTSLLDELLDVTRLQMGQPLELQRSPTDLVDLVRRVVADYQRGTERHQIRLETNEPSLVGDWDAARLTRVVANLVGNAIKYSPAGGEIVVAVAHELHAGESWAVVRVRDRGLGIPAADLPRIFDTFHRAENVVGRIGGAGIGLSASRQLVEQHGGSIAVESVESQGSTFTVRLPLGQPIAGSEVWHVSGAA